MTRRLEIRPVEVRTVARGVPVADTLAEALRLADGNPVHGLVWSATACGFWRAEPGAAEPDRAPGAPGPGEVWSARWFWGSGEVRWTHTAAGLGDAVAVLIDTAGGEPTPVIAGDRRLLWGTVTDIDAPWAVLEERRIGRLSVPACVGAAPGSRLALEVVEIVTHAPTRPDGSGSANAAVVDEILLGVVVTDDADGGGAGNAGGPAVSRDGPDVGGDEEGGGSGARGPQEAGPSTGGGAR